jgi:hypothetical protein
MKSPIRLLTYAALALLGCALFLRDRLRTTFAADSESITWGATDPTWSPDGTRIGFSLFGSIWEVPAEGGPARQISTSSGYHAHPAWSPNGNRIVFINGAAPAGRIPNVSGRLTLVDVDSGREEEIRTPFPTAGTPAWSPDGTRVVCAVAVPNAGALLYDFPVAGGPPRRIQSRMQRAAVGPWVSATWSAPRKELFFAAERTDAPQIWSMPSEDLPVMIQMPLTKYRPGDITQLHSLSAIPDGSGVVYSADIVNGKGDYELYRVPAKGGKPVPITNTTRDEFAPAVSPDSRRVAHVSNHLGNIDLFVMPISGGEKKHVRITELKFRKPSGRLRVRVQDELGKPTPVRLYVHAADGKAYCPSGVQIFYHFLDPGGPREGFFVGSGDDTFAVPAGKVQLSALKGFEYDIAGRTADVEAGQTAEVTIRMQRWANWYQRGWYTGENHFHANYNGSYYQKPKDSLGWIEAEDLNTANMIVANSEGAFIHDKEFFTGKPSPLSTERYVLYWGQEYRNSFPLGHMGFLNISRQVPPSYTSVIGSNSSYDFPLNTMAALEAKKQGGFVTYMHPFTLASADVFDTNLGAKESPLTAALGALNAIDVLPAGGPAYELWYRLLNAGFKVTAGAGTDAFTNWRGINRIPGSARAYVEVGSAMSWERWLARYREGRNFVTNGPVLMTFQVNGEPMGATLRASGGSPYRAKLTAEITSHVPIQRVELLQNGKVIETKSVNAVANALRVDKEVEVGESCWFAARVTGQPARGFQSTDAHSGAIFVHVDGRPVLIKEDVELMIRWIDRFEALLDERNNYGPGENRKRAKAMIAEARSHYQNKLGRAR